MSDTAESVSEAVERLGRRDFTLKYLNLTSKKLTDAELAELADCLLAHPDIVIHIWLASNQLTDETGVKLARYLAASCIVQTLDLALNRFGEATYLALAAALRGNASLRVLMLEGHQDVDRARVDAAFIEALQLNPVRPAGSEWLLYSTESIENDFKRLKDTAKQAGHPSLQMLLAQRS